MLKPSSTRLYSHVEQVLSHRLSNCKTVVVGVSGGVDSMTLLQILVEFGKNSTVKFVVAHVNHNLRGAESDEDEKFVSRICHANGLDIRTVSVDVMHLQGESGMGIEAAARELRYRFFRHVVLETQANALLLAHNADDVAETIVMNLARGSGVRGLAAFPEARNMKGTSAQIIRPLRSILKTEILEYATVHNIEFRNDSSNSDLNYLRNAVRTHVLPVLKNVMPGNVVSNMVHSADLLSDALSIVTTATNQAAAETIMQGEHDIQLKLEKLDAYTAPMRREVIRAALNTFFHNFTQRRQQPSYADTVRVEALCKSEVGSRATLHEGIVAVREREHVSLQVSQGETSDFTTNYELGQSVVQGFRSLQSDLFERSHVKVSNDTSTAYVDAETLQPPLTWRTWLPADRFVPLGMTGSVLVSDLLTNNKVLHSSRKGVTILEDQLGIFWVCGVRIADRVRVTSTTNNIAVIRIS